MAKRYFTTLIVTTWVALLPVAATGVMAWLVASLLSLGYILFTWYFSAIRERDLVMYIEGGAMVWALFAFIERYLPKLAAFLSLESQWFWLNYTHTMRCCFFLQIVVIIIGLCHSGELKRILSICFSRADFDKRNYSHLFCSEGFLCTKTPEIYQPR